jgi:hypothetical protein
VALAGFIKPLFGGGENGIAIQVLLVAELQSDEVFHVRLFLSGDGVFLFAGGPAAPGDAGRRAELLHVGLERPGDAGEAAVLEGLEVQQVVFEAEGVDVQAVFHEQAIGFGDFGTGWKQARQCDEQREVSVRMVVIHSVHGHDLFRWRV